MRKTGKSLVWSADAENDLLVMWRYSADRWSPAKADDYERDIWNACRNLLEFPLYGRSRDDLIRGLRSLVVHAHVIFYKPASPTVEIIRILHGKEDVESIFK